MHPARCARRFCDLFGVDVPIVQTGMGWVAGPRLVSATARRRRARHPRLGDDDLRRSSRSAIARGEGSAPTSPFGVNLRADAADIGDRVELLVDEQRAGGVVRPGAEGGR